MYTGNVIFIRRYTASKDVQNKCIWVEWTPYNYSLNLSQCSPYQSVTAVLYTAFQGNVTFLLPARRRPQGLVVIGVCLSVCLSVRTVLSARYLKNRFMDHHQIWWVGAGGEPLEQVQFWC